MRRRLLRLGCNLSLAVVSVAIALSAVELGARSLAVQVPYSLYPSPENCLQRSPFMGQNFRPSCAGTLSRTSFRTNKAGLRGPAIRDDSSIRVLALGDSCTWGWRVSDEETYPARLGQLLDYRWNPGRYQVLNAGVPGTTSFHGRQFLRASIGTLRPALVIIGYGFNDADLGGDVETQIGRETKVLPLLRLDDWLLDNSHAYKGLRWRIWYRQERSQEQRVSVDKYTRNLSEMVELSRQAGARVLFLGFDSFVAHAAARAQVARSLGVPLILYKGPRMDLVHPTAEGYKSLAGEILDRITVDGTLDSLAGATALPSRIGG